MGSAAKTLTCFALLFILFPVGMASARQKTAEIPMQLSAVEETLPTQQPDEEILQPTRIINIDAGLLSVNITEQTFGDIIREIARKAGIRIKGNPTALRSRFSTRFEGMELDHGLLRLFSLARVNNFSIQFANREKVSVLEFYAMKSSSPQRALRAPEDATASVSPALMRTARAAVSGDNALEQPAEAWLPQAQASRVISPALSSMSLNSNDQVQAPATVQPNQIVSAKGQDQDTATAHADPVWSDDGIGQGSIVVPDRGTPPQLPILRLSKGTPPQYLNPPYPVIIELYD